MQVSVSRTRTIELCLTEPEAEWLRDFVQNYPGHALDEDRESRTRRHNMHAALRCALED